MNRFTKALLFAGTLGLAFLFIMKLVVENRVDSGLDRIVSQLSLFATASYDEVKVNLWGSRVSVYDIEIDFYGDEYPAFRADRLSLELGDSFFFKKALGMERKAAPDSGTVSIAGLRLPVDAYVSDFNQFVDRNNKNFRARYEPNCGDIEFLSFRELAEIGYQYPYIADYEMSYRFNRPEQRVLLGLRLLIPDMALLKADLEIDNVAALPVPQAPQLPTEAELSQMEVTYNDLGYVNRINNYCAERENIPLAEYIQRQTRRPDASFAIQWGAVPNQDIRNLYGEFLKLPRSIQARISPDQDFIQHLALYDKTDWARLLRLKIAVNGQPVDLKGFSRPPQPLWASASPATGDNEADADQTAGQSRPARPSGPSYRTVPVAQLARHIGRTVRIRERSGKEREGKLKDCNQDEARIAQRLYGGEYTVPVKLANIARAEVRM